MPVLTPPERVGTVIGARYELKRIVGQGASAVLFASRDRVLGRDVAVKVMRPDGALSGEQQRQRFATEAQLLARLSHPNLVDVYDVGETDDGVPFVVVELLSGESLADRLERVNALSVEETLTVLLPVIGALACAHDVGVIHRDVKPANIFLHQPGPGACVPKLLDFGIARATDATGLTSSGIALGTPAYMAPEQTRGEPLGPPADVWSMGVTLHRCLSGRLPFEAVTAAGVMLEATRQGAPSLNALLPSLDPGLALAVERALEPRLARRHADMRTLAEALVRTACRAKIKLPAAPDPIGLASYERWCNEARSEEHTAASAISGAPAVQSGRHLIGGGPRRLKSFAVVAAVLACVALLTMSRRAASPVAHAVSSPASIPTPRQPARAPEPVVPATSVALEEPLAQPPRDASVTEPTRAHVGPKTSPRARTPRHALTDAPSSPLQAPPAVTPPSTASAKPKLVGDWSW